MPLVQWPFFPLPTDSPHLQVNRVMIVVVDGGQSLREGGGQLQYLGSGLIGAICGQNAGRLHPLARVLETWEPAQVTLALFQTQHF